MPLSYRSSSVDLKTSKRRHKCAAPKFYAVPHNRLAEEGETIRFQCAVAGHPAPWSTWDRDGVIVMSTNRITVKEKDDIRILEIEQVTSEDAGLYRVTIENEFGRMEATARLDVLSSRRSMGRNGTRTSASPGRSITSSRRIMGNSTSIGGRLALACNFRGSSVPARKFYHDGKVIVDSDRVAISHEGDWSRLSIDNVTAFDAGLYTCVAEDAFGAVASSSTLVTFNDSDDLDVRPKAPSFVKSLPSHISCPEGTPVDLNCTVRSSEPFEVHWYRDDELLQDTSEFTYIDHGDGLLALRIQDPFCLDTGAFSCVVKTASSSCQTETQLEVTEITTVCRNEDDSKEQLQFEKTPLPVVALQGSVVSFAAKVWPLEAMVNWSICGREVNESTRGILVSVFRFISLIVRLLVVV